MLFLTVAIWALSAPDSEDVLAKNADRVICSAPSVPASACIDDNTYVQPEPVAGNPSIDAGVMQSASIYQPEPLIINPEPLITNIDAPYVDKQWALSKINMSRLWQITTGSQEVMVAILDTGIDRSHEELDGLIIAEADFTDDVSPNPNDAYGHGTHIAGIIAAKDNGLGIIGVAPECRLLNVKVADDTGRCQALALAKGIVWAANRGANVINISIEIRESSPELEEAIDYAWNHGCLLVAAAGNDGSESPVYPAYYENCIAVAATKQDDSLAPLSNHSEWVDVAAPGFDIYSTLPDNGYGHKSGTSFACAYVSGMAALLFDMVSDTNGDGRLNDEVRTAIESGCQEIGVAGVGRGRIDAAKAIGQIYQAS